jgi:type IX secretion system PorP/SprF family membrane protein
LYFSELKTLTKTNILKLLVALILCLIIRIEGISQNYSVSGGYFLNPYTYNPAEAATGQLQAFISHRKQWVGLNGAPSLSTLGVTSLLNNTRVGVGFKASSFKRGFLTTSDANLTFAYGVPLDKTSRLFFGLSGGALINSIDWSMVGDASDPALGTIKNSTLPAASFGMLYRNASGLNFGVALPKLIGTVLLDSDFSFTPFDNVILSAYYSNRPPAKSTLHNSKTAQKNKSKKVKYSPLEVYTIYRYSKLGGQIEVTGKYNLNSSIWLAASYRQTTGIIPSLGLNLGNLAVSYFYESGFAGEIPLKTHEIWLGLKLGGENKFKEKTPPVVARKGVIQSVAKNNTGKSPVKTEPVKDKPSTTGGPRLKTETPIPNTDQKTVAQTEQKTNGKEPVPVPSVDTAAVHAKERAELQKHIDDHKDGTHDDAHESPVSERHEFAKRGNHHEELEEGTHVITGAFASRANAEHFVKSLKSLGYADADFGHLSVKNIWYVFLTLEADVEKAKSERNRLQKNKMFKDVWLLTVHQ